LLVKSFGIYTDFDGCINATEIKYEKQYNKRYFSPEKTLKNYGTRNSHVIWCYDMIDTLGYKIGDHSKYDALCINLTTHEAAREHYRHMNSIQGRNWKIYGYKTGSLLVAEKYKNKTLRMRLRMRKTYKECLKSLTTRALVL
jgi:hypothetical protein